MDDMLRVEVQNLKGSTLLTVVGEVDVASMLALQAPLDELSFERDIVVDMSGVRFMDSRGLKAILTQRMRMIENGGSIHIRNPSRAVRLLLEVSRLDDVLCEPEGAASRAGSGVEAAIAAGDHVDGIAAGAEPLVNGLPK